MATKDDLKEWLLEALRASNGSGKIVQLSKHIWNRHEQDLRQSGDLFYTWQYDVRWAANALRHERLMRAAEISPKGVWELVR